MKKKTFIVQLLDSKKPNRKSFTQVEDANFYSNDTDASLVFIPHEDSFDFQSAKVVMYNRGDESLVERDMEVTTEDGRKVASYELPAEIIAHWGDWTAQPVFNSGGEIYSGAIVPFSVIRYLMHERPATLTEIVTVTEFIEQSQALVDDMEQAEAQRKTAESSRTSAETQRLSDETVRASAEAQRKIDHANRSAELAGKADKVVLKNLIENGNFESTSPIPNGTTLSDGFIEFTGSSTGVSRFQFPTLVTMGNKYYIQFKIRYIADKPSSGAVSLTGVGFNLNYRPLLGEPNSWATISATIEANLNTTLSYIYLQGTVQYDDFILIDLTETFGAGNEPTKEEMDELINVIGHIDGTYRLDNKEMLGYLMNSVGDKANIKQEEWQILPLVNGWTSDEPYWGLGVRFYKDTLNRVHFEGYIDGASSTDLVIGVLPIGYRPNRRIGAASNDVGARIDFLPDGAILVVPVGASGFISTSFMAE